MLYDFVFKNPTRCLCPYCRKNGRLLTEPELSILVKVLHKIDELNTGKVEERTRISRDEVIKRIERFEREKVYREINERNERERIENDILEKNRTGTIFKY